MTLLSLFVASCATQSRYRSLSNGPVAKPLPETYDVQVYVDTIPQRPFEKVSRLDVHIEKTHFVGSSLESALPELKKQARLSGAQGIIDIRETKSRLNETTIYHVTGTGIRFTDENQLQ